MAAIGGSIESISIDGREFAVAADADASLKTGGSENEIAPNGNGTVRVLATRAAWSLSGLTVVVDGARDDLQFLQDTADRKRLVACAVTLASGAVYSGRGIVTGELAASSASSTVEVTLGGEGRLERQ